MEAFEQWKRLIGALSSVDSDLQKHIALYSDLLSVLAPQLEEIPQDFLVDIVASNNFIFQSLRKLFRNINTDGTNGRLKAKARRLQEHLTQKFSWDFSDIDDEDDDELPVVVMTQLI